MVAADLEFLRGAGDAGDEDDVLRVESGFFGVVGLVHSAEHLLRAFAGGQVGDEVRVEGLTVLYPAGAAAGDQGQRAPGLDPAQEFGGLLHDGQVGREISVKHAVETQPPEGRRQLPLHIGPDGQAEHLSQPRPDTGGRLYHHMLLGVTQGVPHQARVVLLIEGTGGAGDDALSAVDARGLA